MRETKTGKLKRTERRKGRSRRERPLFLGVHLRCRVTVRRTEDQSHAICRSMPLSIFSIVSFIIKTHYFPKQELSLG